MSWSTTVAVHNGFYWRRSGPGDPSPEVFRVVADRCWGTGGIVSMPLDCGEWWREKLTPPPSEGESNSPG